MAKLISGQIFVSRRESLGEPELERLDRCPHRVLIHQQGHTKDATAWLKRDEHPGEFFVRLRRVDGKTKTTFQISDANVAFEFKMNWG